MTEENIDTEVTHATSATDTALDETAYEYIVATFKGLGTCLKHKYIAMTFNDEIDEETLSLYLDLAIELGDLVKPTIGCISAPEFAETSYPPTTDMDEWDKSFN